MGAGSCEIFGLVRKAYFEKTAALDASLDAEPEARRKGGGNLELWRSRKEQLNATDRPLVPLFICGVHCDHLATQEQGRCDIQERLAEDPEAAEYAEQVLGISVPAQNT